ncbi:hypothetical protein J2X04_000954 [Lysobacter niabensis]|uniref:Uncharacterized protein n=1 Tax=Agrilutibacter niabensis TaxID=380628 RepID=A0ABU1VM97_9GAMM|nr:hypothetical protein [Lysobacter niabensis]MDR7098607.1 hypothetical protein [Lysobacter niabensis]
MTLEDVLEIWIPYRLQAVEMLEFAWEWADESSAPRSVDVVMNGQLKIRGNVAMIANPMIEAGLIHARALLEFLGLCSVNGRLARIKKRKTGDIAIEHFSTPQYPLAIVHPDVALAAYPGPKADAENALLAIFELANKGMAHITDNSFSQAWTDQHLDIACRGIPVLLHNHLYAKLGRNVPKAPEAIPDGR